MLLKIVHVRNFRSLRDARLDCDRLTAIVGRNGAGKSSFLRALEIFHDAGARIEAEDFYDADTGNPIEITVTYHNLRDEERDRFRDYLIGDDLTVTKVVTWTERGPTHRYFGETLRNPDFATVRSAGLAGPTAEAFRRLRQTAYPELPNVSTKSAQLAALDGWEHSEPGRCTRTRDEGQFFGFTEVAQGYLGRHTRFLSIPAVRDVSQDSLDARGSAITKLVDVVVRSALAQREDLDNLRADTQAQFDRLMEPERQPELHGLEEGLSLRLKEYVPASAVSMSLILPEQVELPVPIAEVRLVEDGYASTVDRSGHGLQRAFVLALLQQLAAASGEPASSPSLVPDVILLIEEPEIYQHPNRQRFFAQLLRRLASRESLPQQQIVYATHSPFFVGLDRFDNVRLLRREIHSTGKPRETVVNKRTAEEAAAVLQGAVGGQGFTGVTFLARLTPVMTPWMSEGFFSDLVVLVEGEEDRAWILGTAASLNYDFEGLGISVIPCNSKNSLDRPYVVFTGLKIPTYVVWDGDKGATSPRPDVNRCLLRLVRGEEQDWPSSCVTNSYAVFERDLTSTSREEIGADAYDEQVAAVIAEYGMSTKKDAFKSVTVIDALVRRVRDLGLRSVTLEALVNAIVAARAEH